MILAWNFRLLDRVPDSDRGGMRHRRENQGLMYRYRLLLVIGNGPFECCGLSFTHSGFDKQVEKNPACISVLVCGLQETRNVAWLDKLYPLLLFSPLEFYTHTGDSFQAFQEDKLFEYICASLNERAQLFFCCIRYQVWISGALSVWYFLTKFLWNMLDVLFKIVLDLNHEIENEMQIDLFDIGGCSWFLE